MTRTFGVCVVVLGMAFAGESLAQSWRVQKRVSPDGRVSVERVVAMKSSKVPAAAVRISSRPFYLPEGAPPSEEQYEEWLYPQSEAESFLALAPHPTISADNFGSGTEVRTLVQQGPAENRINLTFVGDGYTLAEKDKYFEDVKRLTKDLFEGQTFASYLPLFNVYAVFVPSRDSGITDGSKRRDTALGLYRDPPGSKRAVMPGNTRAIDAATALAPRTDYPIVVANDDYYGGLGGKYAITTRSLESGSMVLRHELGHNFGDVGEEYEGGYVYSGANHSSNARSPSWSHWLENGTARANDYRYLSGEYLWENLSDGPQVIQFDFPSSTSTGDHQFQVLLSGVGWATPDDVHVFLNGQKVEYEGQFTVDRSFFKLEPKATLAPGRHRLEVRENVRDGDNVFAFAQLYAFPPEYDRRPNQIGAFSSFNVSGRHVGYRPTHESCLMRDMRSVNFCSVDQENMWLRFLDRVTLIDRLSVMGGFVRLETPALPGLEISWFRVSSGGQETEIAALRGRTEWTVAEAAASGIIRAKVRFSTSEIRKQSTNLTATADIKL